MGFLFEISAMLSRIMFPFFASAIARSLSASVVSSTGLTSASASAYTSSSSESMLLRTSSMSISSLFPISFSIKANLSPLPTKRKDLRYNKPLNFILSILVKVGYITPNYAGWKHFWAEKPADILKWAKHNKNVAVVGLAEDWQQSGRESDKNLTGWQAFLEWIGREWRVYRGFEERESPCPPCSRRRYPQGCGLAALDSEIY